MSAIQYTQWIFPKVQGAGPKVEMRLNVKSNRPLLGMLSGAGMQGIYNSARSYNLYDKVYYAGILYYSTTGSNAGNTPGTNADWALALNFDYIQKDQTKVMTLPSDCRMFTGGMGPIRKDISRQEGQLTPDTRDITLLDLQRWYGTSATGVSDAEDLLTTLDPNTEDAGYNQYYKSLIQRMMPDATATYTVFFGHCIDGTLGVLTTGYLDDTSTPFTFTGRGNYNPAYGTVATWDVFIYNNDTWTPGKDANLTTLATLTPGVPSGLYQGGEDENYWIKARGIYFIGDVKAQNNTYSHLKVYSPGSEGTVIEQTVKLTAETVYNRFGAFKVGDTLPWFQGMSGPYQCVGGYIPIDAAVFNTQEHGGSSSVKLVPTDIPNIWDLDLTDLTIYSVLGLRSQLRTACNTVNDGMHFISFSKIIAAFCTLGNFTFDEGNDLQTSLTAWMDKSQQSGFSGALGQFTSIQKAILTGAPQFHKNLLQELGVIYEWLVGSDPRCYRNVSEITSDAGFNWDMPDSDIIKAIAILFGCYTKVTFDQVNHRGHFSLIDRSQSSGVVLNDVCSKWQWKGSEVTQRLVSAEHVETNNAGDKDIEASPSQRGTALTKVIQVRAKKLAKLNTLTADASDPIINADLALGSQGPTWSVFSGGLNGGRHIYLEDVTITFLSAHDGFDAIQMSSPSADFSSIIWYRGDNPTDPNGNSLNPSNCDVVLFPCTYAYSGPGAPCTGYGQIYGVPDRNTIQLIVANTTSGGAHGWQYSSGGPQKILIGYNTGSLTSINDSGWVFDIAMTAGSNVITTGSNWGGVGGTDGTDIYGNAIPGQQIILPNVGIFHIQRLDWNITNPSLTTVILDQDMPYTATGIEGRLGGPQINSSCLLGAFVYAVPDDNPLLRFPPNINLDDAAYNTAYKFTPYWAPSQSPVNPFWGGSNPANYSEPCIATVSRMEFLPNPIPSGWIPDDFHGNSLWTHAQFYAAQEIGDFVQVNISFFGCLDDNGTFAGYDLLAVYNQFLQGQYQTLLLIGLEIDELKNTVLCKFLGQNPVYGMPFNTTSLPVWIKGTNGSSGAAGGSGGTGGSGASTGTAGLTWAANATSYNLSTSVSNDNLSVDGTTNINLAGTSTTPYPVTGFIATGARASFTCFNNTGYPVTYKNSATSLAANQIYIETGTDVICPANGSVTFSYDPASAKWKITATSFSGSQPIIAADSLGSNTDNYAPPVCDILRLTVTADCELLGIVAGYNGQQLRIDNIGTHVCAIINNNSGTPANGFLMTGNKGLVPHSSITLEYNSTSQKWTCVAFSS